MRAFCTSSSPSARASCDATWPCASATSAPLRVCASASRRALSARAVVICASIFDSSVSRRLLADRTALSALARASAMSAFFCTSADCRRPMLSR